MLVALAVIVVVLAVAVGGLFLQVARLTASNRQTRCESRTALILLSTGGNATEEDARELSKRCKDIPEFFGL